ncbi:MAG: DUF4375 domain-containing protein [Planctomycetes bacterium]|nr:DUF4375 domain-containing protein [Planctomycetota bacterium]
MNEHHIPMDGGEPRHEQSEGGIPRAQWPEGSILGRLFAGPDDRQLLWNVGAALQRKADEKGLASLSLEQRSVLLSCTASGVVDNGGFQFFFEAREHRAQETLAALEEVGAKKAARALRQAQSVFPDDTPHEDWEERMTYLRNLDEQQEWRFEGETEELESTAMDPILSDYLRRHEAAFTDLPDPEEIDLPLPPPPEDASDRTIAAWVQSMGGEVVFEGHTFPSGTRKTYSSILPGGELDLREVLLPGFRRDLDEILGHLGRWRGAAKIEVLRLKDAHFLTRAGLRALETFSSLHYLDLTRASVDDENIEEVCRCAGLVSLELSKTGVSDEGLRKIARLELRSLGLEGSEVRGSSLRHFPQLRSLWLGPKYPSDPNLSFLADCTQLEDVTFSNMPLGPKAVERIAALEKLYDLALYHNGLSEKALAPLAGHQALSRLDFQGISFTSEGACILKTIKGLRELTIPECEITEEARRILREAFPGAELEFYSS